MKRLKTFIALLLITVQAISQEKQPKIIIGIVVDQMRYDYLERFWDDFGDNGFKQLVNKGFNCKNVHYNYKPTYTGPGHASIFTGTTPSEHGIIGNNWYSRELGKVVYCVSNQNQDGTYSYSPRNLKNNSIADEIVSQTRGKGKSFAVSLKDRGAILPGGHTSNGAYWFDDKNGKWISSDYYSLTNPEWLKTFNETDFLDTYLKEGWELSLTIDNYAESAADQNDFERPFVKEGKVVFPYNLMDLYEKRGWSILKGVPSGNQMTIDLASKIIQEESLGKDEYVDFLSISFSATDYVGHQFGVQSVEVHDTYIKLDQTLANFLLYLDNEIGKNNYLLFLTSDHGAGMPRKYLEAKKIPCGYIDTKKNRANLDKLLDSIYSEDDWIVSIINNNVYFNDSVITKLDVDQYKAVKRSCVEWLRKQAGIKYAFLKDSLTQIDDELIQKAKNGVSDNSGDIIIIEEKNWTSYSEKGSTHGSPYKYDTHVPLIFYGNSIVEGESDKHYSITDIAPTVFNISQLNPNNQFQGEVIQKISR